MRTAMMGAIGAMAVASAAWAAEPSAPVLAGKFIPLPPRGAIAAVRPVAQPTHFMALPQRSPMFQHAVVRSSDGSAQELPPVPANYNAHGLMTRQQAEQIISIFDSDR